MKARYFKVIFNGNIDKKIWSELYKITPRKHPCYYDKYYRTSRSWVTSLKFKTNKHFYEIKARQTKHSEEHKWAELKEEDLFLELL